MSDSVTNSTAVGKELCQLQGKELCEFIIKLCDCVKKDAGTSFRGGVYPSNIFLSNKGEMSIGPANEYNWTGEELNFIAPELYWNSRRSPASDVYSIGLVMYYAFSGGKIPYEGESADPVLRRMTNEAIPIPESAGRRMADIISRAVSFKAADRYQSMDELKAVISSLNNNLFLNGAPTAETVLKKNDDDLSDVERMMVDIIESLDDAAPIPEKEKSKYYQPEKTAEKKPEKKPEKRPAKKPETAVKPGEMPSEPENRVRVGAESEKSEKKIVPPVQYSSTNIERERKLAKELKRRRRRPVIVILIMCVLLLGAAFAFNRIVNEGRSVLDAEIEFNGIITEDPVTPSPSPTDYAELGTPVFIEPETTPEPEPEQPREHSYEFHIENVSWTQAQARCAEMGGHLVVISNAEELQEVINMCEDNGIYQIWIGCHRENGNLVWENGEEVSFYSWGQGEPSAYDYNDDVSEDFVMLWKLRGTWQYNDQRNDPARDYPGMYMDQMGFICEFD